MGTVIPATSSSTSWNDYPTGIGLLASEINEMIRKENNGTPEGELKSRICALIFLSSTSMNPMVYFANAETISDLLVTDLTKGSDTLRKQVPLLLEDLNVRGVISDVGNHVYHIQTKEGKVWDADYQTKFADYKADDTKSCSSATRCLKAPSSRNFREVSIVQGKSKTPRQIDPTIFGFQKNGDWIGCPDLARTGGKCRNP